MRKKIIKSGSYLIPIYECCAMGRSVFSIPLIPNKKYRIHMNDFFFNRGLTEIVILDENNTKMIFNLRVHKTKQYKITTIQDERKAKLKSIWT